MLRVIHPGFYTTIQDAGRFGYRDIGVPVSGYMDAFAARFANALLGNQPEDAVMEISLKGPTLMFGINTRVVTYGAEAHLKLDGEIRAHCIPFQIKAGQSLEIDTIEKGARLYLAVQAGFQTEKILGSRSFYPEITHTDKLYKNQELMLKETEFLPSGHAHVKHDDSTLTTNLLEVLKGPEYDCLTTEMCKKITELTFHVGHENNRMAYKLEEKISENKVDMLTSPTLPGTVQLTPSGGLMILMRDAQTTGGYPRILQLTDTAINILAQKREGDGIRFSLLN
ncbi:MAG: biotin-dependent carboxyltransferase family protein [Flavobacteriaceae bacterium]|nr:biotin-dependent carboxyltransferase family protein [Flavobacteriaceae bacterium]